MSSNPCRKEDRHSYKKPGPNRIVDGVLIIPAEQKYEDCFSFRSAEGVVISDMPIDITKISNRGLLYLLDTIGLRIGANFYSRQFREEALPLVQRHLHIEAARIALTTTITTLSGELADLEEAFYAVKPAVFAVLAPRIAALKTEIAVHNARLEGQLEM